MIWSLFGMGCINDTLVFKAVEISGTVTPQDPSDTGTLHLIAYHAWYGSDDLGYPFHEFDRTERLELDFEWRLEIPQEKGEGLAIRAWLDTDEDDAFCLPNTDNEYGGTVVFDAIDWQLEAEIVLDEACAF